MPQRTAQCPTEQPTSPRTQLLAALKSRAGLRQGFLLAEILMPPVAKRKARARPLIETRPRVRGA